MIRAAAIVLLATALCACQRTTAGSATQSPSRVTPTPPARPIAEKSAAIAPTAPAAAPHRTRPPPRCRRRPATPVCSRSSAQGAQDGTLPEDFEIGPLAAERLLADDLRAAHAAAVTLLDAWTARRVERSSMAPEAREALAGTIGFALERADVPLAWRLGPPRPAGGELVANLRLLAAAGSAEGEIYTAREGGGAMVSDLQIDPARLRIPRERPTRTFFPSPYRWLLGG